MGNSLLRLAPVISLAVVIDFEVVEWVVELLLFFVADSSMRSCNSNCNGSSRSGVIAIVVAVAGVIAVVNVVVYMTEIVI